MIAAVGFVGEIIVWFPLLVSGVTFGVGCVLLARASESAVVRSFMHYATALAFLAFVEWGYRHAPTAEAAQHWIDAGALWPISIAAFWSFGWTISIGSLRPNLNGWRLVSYAPALVLTALGFLLPSMSRFAVRRWWGFAYELQNTPAMVIALVWGTVTSLAIGGIIFLAYRRYHRRSHDLQRGLLLAGLVNIAAAIVAGIVRAFVAIPTPEFTTAGTAIFIAIIGFSVYRHGLWEFAPRSAAGTVLQTMDDAVLLVDHTNTVRYANRAAVELFGNQVARAEREPCSCVPSLLLEPEVLGKNLELTVSTGAGTDRHVSVRIEPMPSGMGGRLLVFRDTEEQVRHRERLSHLAYHDALTGIGNRTLFFRRLKEQLSPKAD